MYVVADLLYEEVGSLIGRVKFELESLELVLGFGCELQGVRNALLQFDQEREDGLIDLDRPKHFDFATL